MSNYQGNIIIKNPATPTGPFENGSAPGIWTLSEAMTFKRQGIWPTQGVQGSDAYFKYVSLLLSNTALGNANNNLFVDSSGAFNPISRNGNTTQGSFTPYSANWSNYFDGDGDYLTFANNAAFGFGTGDYTVEFWIYLNTLPASNKYTIVDFRTAAGAAPHTIYVNASGYLGFFNGSTDVASSSAPMTANSWTHIAYSRSSGTLRIYVNGVQAYSAANTIDYQSSRQCRIGAAVEGIEGIPGYISNFRVVKGTGLYTSAFTPPSSALTAVSGTTLLTCQSNRFRDASSNNFTATVNGNTSVTDFAPFSPTAAITYNQSDITNWSGYFDGSGDYLYAPNNTALDIWDNGSGSFTVEAWIFATASIPNNVSIAGKASLNGNTPFNGWAFQVFSGCLNVNTASNNRLFTNSTTVPLNQWVHVALVKSGSTISIYQNGTRVSTITNTSTYSNTADQLHIATDRNPAGSSLTGYMSNLRIVKGVAVYDPTQSTLTVPTSALTAVSGTSLLTLQNAAFTDNSSNKFLLTQYGNVTVTGNSPFNAVGYWSNYFDGSSTLSFSSISLAGDFTIEGWVYYTSTSGNPTLIGENPPNNQALRRLNGKHYFYFQGPSITGTIDLPANQWVHLAVTRSSGTVRIFTNGVLDGSASMNGTYSVFCLGGVDTSTDRLTGYASNVRVVNGTALYTATFTPSTTPLTAVSGTTLLTAQNGTFKDNSTNNRTLTINGSPTVQSFDPFYTSTIASNGGSMYFDGSGDYLSVPSSPGLNFGTSNWTIECWVYVSTRTTNYPLIFGNNRGSFTTDALAITASNSDSASYNDKFAFAWGSSGFSSPSAGNSYLLVSNVANVNGSWYHLAIVRESSTSVKMYRNGVQVANATVSSGATFNWGYNGSLLGGGNWDGAQGYFNGYISNLRATPSAVYTSAFTPPTAPVTPTAATTLLVNGMNAGIYDATAINDMETVGNVQVSTVQSKFDGSSLYFDGSGDYLSLPGGPQNYYGSGNFTIEGWFYFNATPSNMPLLGWGNTSYKVIRISTTSINVESDNPSNTSFNVSFNASKTLTTGVWYHIALVRSGNSFTAYVDGVGGTAYTSFTGNVGHASDTMYIGYKGDPTYFNGYIDDLRITKGIARYTANFTPPTNPFQLY